MGTTVIVLGEKKLKAKFRRAVLIAPMEFQRTCMGAGRIVQTKARRNLRASGTVDRSTLVHSISVRPIQHGLNIGAEIGTNAPHAKPFEGPERSVWSRPPPAKAVLPWFTRHGLPEGAFYGWIKKKMPYLIEPRPYLKPAAIESVPEINRLFSAAVRRILTR